MIKRLFQLFLYAVGLGIAGIAGIILLGYAFFVLKEKGIIEVDEQIAEVRTLQVQTGLTPTPTPRPRTAYVAPPASTIVPTPIPQPNLNLVQCSDFNDGWFVVEREACLAFYADREAEYEKEKQELASALNESVQLTLLEIELRNQAFENEQALVYAEWDDMLTARENEPIPDFTTDFEPVHIELGEPVYPEPYDYTGTIAY